MFRSRCALHNFVVEDDIVEGMIDQQEEHIFYYHTDELRERSMDGIRLDWFTNERDLKRDIDEAIQRRGA